MRWIVGAVILASLLGTGAQAADLEVARQRYARALEFVNSGKHREAILEFDAAYTLSRLPNILYNIGEEYRVLGSAAGAAGAGGIDDLTEAILYYHRYLDASKEPSDRAEVEKKVAALEAAIDKQKRDLGKGHYDRAVAFVDAGRHRDAITAFNQAYALVPLPNILWNIAREYHLLGDSGGIADSAEVGDMKQAVAFYRRYLVAKKDAPDLMEVAAAIKGLEDQIANAGRPRKARPTITPLKARVFAPAPPPLSPEEEAREKRRARAISIGLGVGIAAAVLTAGAAVGGAVAASSRTEYCTTRDICTNVPLAPAITYTGGF